jgi:hypothetical protein
MTRFLDAVLEPSFRRTPDGRWVVFAWGRRGYELPSEERFEALRREARWMSGIVLFGYPMAGCALGQLGLGPVIAFVVSTALAFNLRLAWLLRGLPRTLERQTAAESRAATAAALSERQIWGVTLVFLAMACVALALAIAQDEPIFVLGSALCVATAAWIGGGLFRLKRRGGRGRG